VDVTVIVEIPKGSRNKYEYDHDRDCIRLDRMLFTATGYPTDYGFVPDTLGEDGDPIDALVLLEEPTFPGCLVQARVVAVFWMIDEHGPDAKLLCVPSRDPRHDGKWDLGDIPEHLRNEIAHFFNVYKDLEPEKCVEIQGWQDRVAAEAALQSARARHASASERKQAATLQPPRRAGFG
jgi:inorganic pyrophosphatase